MSTIGRLTQAFKPAAKLASAVEARKAEAPKKEAPKKEADQVRVSAEARQPESQARPAVLNALAHSFGGEHKAAEPQRAAQAQPTAEPQKTSVPQPDGSTLNTQTVTHPDGSRDVETVVVRPDGTQVKTTAHAHTSDRSIEELKGGPVQPSGENIEGREHPQGAPDTGYQDAPGQVGPEARRDKTEVVESRTVIIGPDGRESELETTTSYSQRVHVEGGELPYGAQLDPSQSGLTLTHVEKSSLVNGKMETASVDGSELKLVGRRPDGTPISATRSDAYDNTNGQLTTQKEVKGYTRAELQYLTEHGGVAARVGGREMSVTPQGIGSGHTPTDHLERADQANDFLGVGPDQPLNVRVSVTQDPSSGKKPAERVELGNYDRPDQDGKTLVRLQEPDGAVHWTYQKVSNGGRDNLTQDVIEGSDYNHVQKSHRSDDGTFTMSDDVHLGDKHVSHRQASRTQTAPGPVASYQDHLEAWSVDPTSGVRLEDLRVDSTETPSLGQRQTSVYSKKLLTDTLPAPDFKNPRSLVYEVDKLNETIDKNGVRTQGSHVSVTDVDRVIPGSERSSGFTVDSQGRAWDSQGRQLAVPPLDLSNPTAAFESFAKVGGPLGDALQIPGFQALSGAFGLFQAGQGLSELDLKKTTKGLGQFGQGAEGLVSLLDDQLASNGLKKVGSLSELGELTLAKKFGAVGGVLSFGVGISEIFTGQDGWQKAGGAIDAVAGGLVVAGLFWPPAAAIGGLLSLGKLGYDYIYANLKGSSTPPLDAGLA